MGDIKGHHISCLLCYRDHLASIETNKKSSELKTIENMVYYYDVKKQSLKTTMPKKHSNPLLFKLFCVFKEQKRKIFRNIVAIR